MNTDKDSPTSDEVAVEVKNLTVRFGEFTAVDDISFNVTHGEIFGFLGANGAGKTTTIRVLCGIIAPTFGFVRVEGQDFENSGTHLKNKVGYMSQKFTLYDDLTVNENLAFASQLRKITHAVFQKRSQELLNFIGFYQSQDVLVKNLPGGIKQQVSLVAALLHDPEVLFLDEPTAGVTPAARARFWELIRHVAAEGKTVFVTTHYMDEAEQCSRVALMRAGKLVALDSPMVLKNQYFPNGLLELEPKNRMHSEDIERFSKSAAFSLFEPYGMRYHAEIQDHNEWIRIRKDVEHLFFINKIPPSLEDVFIRVVEDQPS